MKTVTTYLHFNGNCRQAMSFYQQCVGAELQLTAYPDDKCQPSSDPLAPIMHAQLSRGSAPILMASDAPPGEPSPQPGTDFFSVAIECESVEEIDRLFAALGQNGKVRMPLSNVPWGARFGMLTDQFSIQWMFNCTLTKIETSQRNEGFMTNKITVETTIAAPIEEIWRAWSTPEDIKQWNAASDDWHTTKSEVDLRVGGAFSSRMEAKDGSIGFDFAGTYKKVVEHKLIESAFGDRTLVVEFIPGHEGVTVRETFDADTTHSVEQQRGGWQAILNNFKRHVEDPA